MRYIGAGQLAIDIFEHQLRCVIRLHHAALRHIDHQHWVSNRLEQQAVTPISENRTRYLFGTGIDRDAPPDFLEGVFKIVNSAFAEDRLMIETQQKIWDLTPPDVPKAFIPQDKAPAILRRLIAKRLAEEVQIS